MELLDLSTLMKKCPVLVKLAGRGYQLAPTKSADIGIRFHEAIAKTLTEQSYDPDPLTDYLVHRAKSELYLLFHFNSLEVEKAVWIDFPTFRLVGIVDLLLYTDQGIILIDWKTTQRDFKQSPLQLNVYRYIMEKSGQTVIGTYYIKVRFRKIKQTYVADIVPVVCPTLPNDLVEKKVEELVKCWEMKKLPAMENCGFCPLQDICEPHLHLSIDEMTEQIVAPALNQGLLVQNNWKEFLATKIKEASND